MKLPVYRTIVVALVLACLVTGVPAQTITPSRELPNFHRVNQQLYRSGQPQAGSLNRIAALGIKTIINLRGEADRVDAEEREAETLGLRYFNLPLPVWGRPPADKIEQALKIINDSANWPVLVYCQRGADRTGTVIACYRISTDNWTTAQALQEAKENGMSWVQYWMKDFIADYARDHARANAPAPATLGYTETAADNDSLEDKLGTGFRVAETALRRSQRAVAKFFRRAAKDN